MDSICNKTFEQWWENEGTASAKKIFGAAWSNGGYKAIESVENKSESNGKNIYVVVCERDMPDTGKYKDQITEAIVMETTMSGSSIESATLKIKSLQGRYGKCRIAKLVFIDEA